MRRQVDDDAKMAKAKEEERRVGVWGGFSYLLYPVYEMMEDFILLFDAPSLSLSLKELISF